MVAVLATLVTDVGVTLFPFKDKTMVLVFSTLVPKSFTRMLNPWKEPTGGMITGGSSKFQYANSVSPVSAVGNVPVYRLVIFAGLRAVEKMEKSSMIPRTLLSPTLGPLDPMYKLMKSSGNGRVMLPVRNCCPSIQICASEEPFLKKTK